MIDDVGKSRLLKAALEHLENAYCPYSGIRVAASVLDNRGRIFAGVNVENASYSLTMCAERNAIAAAIVDGARSIEAVLITSSIGAISPCGACRQVIAEFAEPQVPIYLAEGDEITAEFTVGGLLPEAFHLPSEDK